MAFTQAQILRMFPNTKYYVRNSYGGLLAGTMDLEEAIKYADEYKKEYLEDSLNNKAKIFVLDKQGNKVYEASGKQTNVKNEECEEME